MVIPFEIDVFHGQATPQAAQVYARVEGLPGGKEWTIAGRLRGPECRHAKTLPTNHAFVNLGAGTSLLARAIIPDPCFWSPDLPALYRVSLEIRRHNEIVQTTEQEFGIRFLGVQGKSFYLDAKRWVPRGVSRSLVGDTPLSDWRDAHAAMLVHNPPEDLCREASREGVFLVASVPADDFTTMRRLSRWASVGIVVNSTANVIPADARQRFPNVIFGQRVGDIGDIDDSKEAGLLLVDETTLHSPGLTSAVRKLPIIAMRQLRDSHSLSDARNQCDLLQRDLAAVGDFAGYVIDVNQPQGASPGS